MFEDEKVIGYVYFTQLTCNDNFTKNIDEEPCRPI